MIPLAAVGATHSAAHLTPAEAPSAGKKVEGLIRKKIAPATAGCHHHRLHSSAGSW